MTSIEYSEWDSLPDSYQSYFHFSRRKEPDSKSSLAVSVWLHGMLAGHASSSFGMRSTMSSVLLLQISSLWLIYLNTPCRSMIHASVLQAYGSFTDLASNFSILWLISRQASSFSMQVLDVPLANAVIEVGVLPAYGSKHIISMVWRHCQWG